MTRASTLEPGSAVEWPALPLDAWRDTYATLHMWTQIVGKVCLALTPLTNHFWNIAFQITPRGLVTPIMTAGRVTLTIAFDFVDHQLIVETADGRLEHLPLQSQTVADFYGGLMRTLERLGVRVRIWTRPVELLDPAAAIPFERDVQHHVYDPAAANTCWRVLLAIKPVFDRFRGKFIGKSSPVHFFWGSFDLAVTRFSGERAPERADADAIMREAYSHAVISAGFWPGFWLPGAPLQEPAFYAYAAPEPDGFKQAAVAPAAAYYHRDLSEFILPYEAVRTAAAPGADLTAFLESTYSAAADLAGWTRSTLERQ